MYRVLIVSADTELRRKLEEFTADAGLLGELTSLTHFPAEAEMSRIFNIKRPQLIIALVVGLKETQELLGGIAEYAPSTPFLAVTQIADQRTMSWLMNQGVRACLTQPLNRHVFLDTVKRLLEDAGGPENSVVTDHLFSFIPAKGGSGASTLAANFASVASQAGRGRVLLLDLDQGSGWSRVMFPSPGVHTLIDILEAGAQLDELGWRRVAARFDSLDVVTAGRSNPRHPLLASQIRQMLDHTSTQYKLICADLSGNFEAFSVEVMRRSNQIFLVTSTDPTALRLAQDRIRMLETLDLSSRTRVILTRMTGGPDTSASEVKAELGIPVICDFQMDERRIRESLAQGQLFPKDLSIWKNIQKAIQQFCWPTGRPASGRLAGLFSR